MSGVSPGSRSPAGQLRRLLGLGFGLAVIVGSTIGVGILRTPGLVDPKDDTGQSEIGSWYIRVGQREKGEELIAKALNRNADEMWHYVRAAEAYLGVARGR
jgi:hypothetical protein